MRRLALVAAALALAAPALAQPDAPVRGPTTETCGWMVRNDGKLTIYDAPGPSVLGARGTIERPKLRARIVGVYCERDSLVPADSDDRVPRTAGLPLYIEAPGGVTIVEIKNSRFRISFSDGVAVTPALRDAARALVDRWQGRPSPIR